MADVDVLKPLAGRVALVTGASSGIGEATAVALVAAGAKVAVAARRLDRLEALAAAHGESVFAIQGDVSVEAEALAMVHETQAHFGRLDVLVNNAGVMLLSPALEATLADWKRMVDVNVLGLMYTTHAALPLMVEQKSGHIVNISSTAGRTTNPTASVYNATKHAVGAFSDAIRKEVFSFGIRMTVIEPGVVETELRDHIPHEGTQKGINEWASNMRQLQAVDIANAIVYAVTQPPHVNVNEMLIRPTDQER